MQIIVIAGGSGKRMQPLVTHKTIFPFLGSPILEHTLLRTKEFSPTKTVIVCHPNVENEVKNIGNKYDAQVVVQKESLGMADAILSASELLNKSEAVLIIDAVTIQEKQVFIKFKDAVANSKDQILLGGTSIEEYKHGGYFVFDNQNNVVEIVEKPGADKMPSKFLKLVLDYYPNSLSMFETMSNTKSSNDDVYEVGLSKLIKEHGAKMVEVSGDHASLKHVPRVLDVMDVFLKHYLVPGIDSTAIIAKNATISGDVQIGKNVKVFENAVIKGPAYIGDNTIVGNGALIRESCIEGNCEIGYNTEVARSYVGPGTKCHTSYVGDSIIEGDTNLAAGTITANLRFDNRNVMINLPTGRIDSGRRKFGAILAKGVKTGIHASLMPGTVAESDSIIGSKEQYVINKK